MTHNLGPVINRNDIFDDTTGIDFDPSTSSLEIPRFVILHFDNVNLSTGARLEVPLGYGTDIFTKDSGSNFWSRPVDTSSLPIQIRITGGSGTGRLSKYGKGEPTITPGHAPGTQSGSKSNPDLFLHTNPYQEPIFETRLKCMGVFDWQNSGCELGPIPENEPIDNVLDPIPESVKNKVAAAVGIIVEVHEGHVSSCSGTLIGADLFLTSRHCLTDPSGEDLRSASVTFDYASACDGGKPLGHTTRFFKVISEVAAGEPPNGSEPPAASDWVVVQLESTPGALPTPLEMRDTALMNGELIFTMHHPNGSTKKAQARFYDNIISGDIFGFDFAGGSSGSALFDINGNLVRGPLSKGANCNVSYAPIAPIKNALANPPPPPVPLDVMIVFDRSGSMIQIAPPIGRTKLEEAKDAASLFVQLVREGNGDRIGLVTFSSSATINTHPGPVSTVEPILVGPAPFTTGQVGSITAGGSTSIGGGLAAALSAIGMGSTNDRAILLLTDGLQNTVPMIEDVEGTLSSTKLCVIGFGSDADLDGPLLNRLAREHGGEYTRAIDGLALRKFFGFCFGNIFETGALADPDFILRSSQEISDPHNFLVCNEECITLVLGWDNPSTPLHAHIFTPKGKPLNEKKIETVRGRTWVFWRIKLPHAGERDGSWQFTVERMRIGQEPPPRTDVHYFFLVISSGGPKMIYLGGPRHVYTGDHLDSLIGLHYGNGTTPNAQIELTIDVPTVALGKLVSDFGLRRPSISEDAVDAFHTTLQAIAHNAGGILPVNTDTHKFTLFDDGIHQDGAMEPDGVYNNRLENITKVEGSYQFRAVAKYGKVGCQATRETFWSIHVEPGIDPTGSTVSLSRVHDLPDGRHGILKIIPRDRYHNPLGPGRSTIFTLSQMPGVTIVNHVRDHFDGSYSVRIIWDPLITHIPGILLHQLDRKPVVMMPPQNEVVQKGGDDVTNAAKNLLGSLGLDNANVNKVRVKGVKLEIDIEDQKNMKDCNCNKDKNNEIN